MPKVMRLLFSSFVGWNCLNTKVYVTLFYGKYKLAQCQPQSYKKHVPMFGSIDLNISTGHRTIELCPTKVASQPAHSSGAKLKKMFISYRHLKIHKLLVIICLSCPAFSFYEHFNRQLTYAVFYIQNRNISLNKKILYQYFVVFCPVWDSFSSENI